MSDQYPKVVVRPGKSHAGQYIAWCYEPDCQWAYANSGRGYIEERAKAHRSEHRKAAE